MEVGRFSPGLSVWDSEYLSDPDQQLSQAELTKHVSPYDGFLYKWDRYQIIEVKDPALNNPDDTVTNKYVVPEYSTNNHLRTYHPVPRGWTPTSRYENDSNISIVEIDFDDVLKLAENLDGDEAIIEFYETYGSLGMLLHNVQTISNTDRLTTIPTGWTVDNIPTPRNIPQIESNITHREIYDNLLRPQREIYWREGRNWVRKTHHFDTNPYFKGSDGWVHLTPVKLPSLPKTGYVIMCNDPFNPMMMEYPIDYLRMYFPNLDEMAVDPLAKEWSDHLIPIPTSMAFWTMYGENIAMFKNYIRIFKELAECFLEHQEEETREKRVYARATLNAINDTGPMLFEGDRKYPDGSTRSEQCLGFVSLFGLIANLAQESISKSYGFRVCARTSRRRDNDCNAIFLAKEDKEYCSQKCAQAMATARKRRWQTIATQLGVYEKWMTVEEFTVIYEDMKSKGTIPVPDPFDVYDNLVTDQQPTIALH